MNHILNEMQGDVYLPNLNIYMNNLLRMDDDAINFDDSNSLVFKIDGTWSAHSVPIFNNQSIRLPVSSDNQKDFSLYVSELSI